MANALPVVISTNGKRRRLCLYVIKSLMDNLHYDGGLFFIIACDRCDADVCLELKRMFEDSGFGERYQLVNGTNWADALNCAIKEALKRNECLFRTEDDYVLAKTLDITAYIDIIMAHHTCGVIKFKGPLASHVRSYSGIAGLTYIENGKVRNSMYTATMYPSLMHRRVFDIVGFYKLPHLEKNFVYRFNKQKELKVAAFCDLPGNNMSHKLWFEHAGRSTINHNLPYHRKYDKINEGSSI